MSLYDLTKANLSANFQLNMFVKEQALLDLHLKEQLELGKKIELKELFDQCTLQSQFDAEQEEQFRQFFCNYMLDQYEKAHQNFQFSPTEVIKLALFSKNVDKFIQLTQFWQSFRDCFYIYQDIASNKMCVAILTQLIELVKDEQIKAHYKLFSDLFLLLDSFGTHITKDVWKKMDPFLVPPNFVLDSDLKKALVENVRPIEILIKKAAAHTNEKTIKNCVKTLFKNELDPLLIKHLIVQIIIPVLNKPVFYNDTPLEGDSKFYPLVEQFLQKMPFLDDIIVQIVKHIGYPLSIGAFSVALAKAQQPVSQESLRLLVGYLKEKLGLLNLRKRIQLSDAVVHLFKHNQDPKLLVELIQALPFDCLKWRGENGQIGQQLRELLSEEFRELVVSHAAAKPKDSSELHLLIMVMALDEKIETGLLIGFLIGRLSQIYTSTYTEKETKFNDLALLNEILRFGLNLTPLNQSAIYRFLDQIAPELISYLMIEVEAGKAVAEKLWHFALVHYQNGDNISKYMSKYVGHLFKFWHEKQEAQTVLLILNNILKATNLVIFRAKLLKSSVYVEELFIQHGLDVLEQLQNQNQADRAHRNLYLHYLSNLLTFLREVNHKPPKYEQQVHQLIQNIADIADSYNAYDYVIMFQLLQRVYSPEIALHGEKYAQELKELAINSFNNMMTVFGSHTNLDEILSYVDFILDPCYFSSEICNVIPEILLFLLKQNQKQWVILRKIVNNLTICLYTYPDKLPLFHKILLKLIKGRELRGFDTSEILPEQEMYVPLANKIKDKLTCKGEFHGAYPRFLIFGLLFELAKDEKNHKSLILYTKYLIEQTTLDRYKNAYMQYTKPFRLKLHAWQNICCLKKLLRPEYFFKAFAQEEGTQLLQDIEAKIWKAFDQLNNPLYRQYMELMILYLMESYPDIWGPRILKTLSDTKAQVNLQIPSVFISCVFITHQPKHPLAEKLFKKVFPMVSSNVAYIRSLCQTCCLQYIQKNELDVAYFKDFVEYFQTNRECVKIIKNIEALINRYEKLLDSFDLDGLLALQFDSFGEIIHPCIIDILKNTCIHTISEIKAEDNLQENLPPSWHQYVEKHKQTEMNQESPEFNFQRKINLILSEFEFFKAFKPRQTVGDLIVVATLLDKIPNFGHLTRTCEIFGCRELVIPNKKILLDEQYKAVSVSAEQHLPISEVKEEYLMNYLHLKRMQGYQLVALEQTSQSKQIREFKFQEKTVLILGREKTGLPIEYIELMDACVEIPQFGVIRSLNVHISAVICVWQYVQQFS